LRTNGDQGGSCCKETSPTRKQTCLTTRLITNQDCQHSLLFHRQSRLSTHSGRLPRRMCLGHIESNPIDLRVALLHCLLLEGNRLDCSRWRPSNRDKARSGSSKRIFPPNIHRTHLPQDTEPNHTMGATYNSHLFPHRTVVAGQLAGFILLGSYHNDWLYRFVWATLNAWGTSSDSCASFTSQQANG